MAQEQESKLLDRLLRPNMNLRNLAQDKKFDPAAGTVVHKEFVTPRFPGADAATAKSFGGAKRYSAARVESKEFTGATSSTLGTRSAAAAEKFGTKANGSVRTARESGKIAVVREYPGQRPFLGQGRSQRALNQQDHPLTIEEVRQLLNKGD